MTRTPHPLTVLDAIEREHEQRSRDLTRVLSAAAWAPEPRRGLWWRLTGWIRGRRG